MTNQTKNPFKSIIMKIKSQFAAKMHEKFEFNVGIVFIISLDSLRELSAITLVLSIAQLEAFKKSKGLYCYDPLNLNAVLLP